MTETIIAKSLLGLSAVPVVTFAALDATAQVSIVSSVSLLITTLGTCVSAWIAYKQASLKRTVEVLEKNTNGMKEALNTAIAKENLATGKLLGAADAVNKAAVIAAAKAEGAALAHESSLKPQ